MGVRRCIVVAAMLFLLISPSLAAPQRCVRIANATLDDDDVWVLQTVTLTVTLENRCDGTRDVDVLVNPSGRFKVLRNNTTHTALRGREYLSFSLYPLAATAGDTHIPVVITEHSDSGTDMTGTAVEVHVANPLLQWWFPLFGAILVAAVIIGRRPAGGLALHTGHGNKKEGSTPKAVLTSVLLICICVLGLGLRLHRASDAFDGIHGWNEAHYAIMSRNFLTGTPLSEQVTWRGQQVYWVPPFLSYVLYVVFLMFGVSEAAARVVPSLFSTVSIAMVFLISRRFFSARVGLIAAALVSVNAYYTLFGRNVQTDSIFISLSLISLYFYSLAMNEGGRRCLAVSGMSAGLAVFTKQPALVLIPLAAVMESLRSRGVRKGAYRRLALYAIISLVLVVPWAFHGAWKEPDIFWNTVHGNATRKGIFTQEDFLPFMRPLFPDILWPLVILGAVVALLARDPPHQFLLAWLGLFYGFLMIAHPHEYYLLPLVPIHLILAADALVLLIDWFDDCLGTRWTGRRRGLIRAALSLAVVMVLAYHSFDHTWDMLQAKKYGGGGLRDAGRMLDRMEGLQLLLVDHKYLPPHRFYIRSPTLKVSSNPSELGPVLDAGGEAACLLMVTGFSKEPDELQLKFGERGSPIQNICRTYELRSTVLYNTIILRGFEPDISPRYLLVTVGDQSPGDTTGSVEAPEHPPSQDRVKW